MRVYLTRKLKRYVIMEYGKGTGVSLPTLVLSKRQIDLK